MSSVNCTYKIVSASLSGVAINNPSGGGCRMDVRMYECRPGANLSSTTAVDTVSNTFSVESQQPQAFVAPGTSGTSNSVLQKVGAGAGNITVSLANSIAGSGDMEWSSHPHRWHQEAQHDNQGTDTVNPISVA